jgi:hypothetical protein
VNLLDAAEVKTDGSTDWHRGWEGDSRVCSGIHVYLSECDPAVTADVIGSDEFIENDCGYRVVPFGIIAELDRKTIMSRPDDADWLARSLKASAEIPVSRGLLVRQGMGITAVGGTDAIDTDVWIGSDAAEEVPAPAMTDADAVAGAVSDARAIFFRKTLGIRPVLHVNPGNAVALKRAGVVELDPSSGDDRTAWGDPVVISEGYYDIPDLTVVPAAFWTGPIQIRLSDVNQEDIIREVRRNRERLQVSMLAAIDTPPCAIVRVGPAPAPVAP